MKKGYIFISMIFFFKPSIYPMSPSESGECLCEKRAEMLQGETEASNSPQYCFPFKTDSSEKEESVSKIMQNFVTELHYAYVFSHSYFEGLVKMDRSISYSELAADQERALAIILKTLSNIGALRAALHGDRATMSWYEEKMHAFVNGLAGVGKDTQDTIFTFLDGIEEEAQGILNLCGLNGCLFSLISWQEGDMVFKEQLDKGEEDLFYQALSDHIARIESDIDVGDALSLSSKKHFMCAVEKYKKFYVYVETKSTTVDCEKNGWFWEDFKKCISRRIRLIDKIINMMIKNFDDKETGEIYNLFEDVGKYMTDLRAMYCEDQDKIQDYKDQITKYIFNRQTLLREKLEAEMKRRKEQKASEGKPRFWDV